MVSLLSVGADHDSMHNAWHSARTHPLAVGALVTHIRESSPICPAYTVQSQLLRDSDSIRSDTREIDMLYVPRFTGESG